MRFVGQGPGNKLLMIFRILCNTLSVNMDRPSSVNIVKASQSSIVLRNIWPLEGLNVAFEVLYFFSTLVCFTLSRILRIGTSYKYYKIDKRFAFLHLNSIHCSQNYVLILISYLLPSKADLMASIHTQN